MSVDPIKHVVLLMLENHSFDQMLGCLKAVYPAMEGIDPEHPGFNLDKSGKRFAQVPTKERQMLLDPHHEVSHVATQLQNNNGGFVLDFEGAFSTASDDDKQNIMGYYSLDFLPALHTLARNFTVCDHWFSSLPGPTWPNRFFALSGTSSGRTDMPDDGAHKTDLAGYLEQTQATLFDRLNDAGIDWKIFFHDLPQSLVFARQRLPHNAARYFHIDDFYKAARGDASEFPPFVYIEPRYQGTDQNDDHPPHDIMKAQKLIADVYNAVRANAALWESTLLVVFYDEHGGFYDHVVPPAAEPPDSFHQDYSFTQLGIRVPALLISPWVGRGVFSEVLDHTSFLKYLTEKWKLGSLGKRTAAARTFAAAIHTEGAPRTDTPESIILAADQLAPPDAAKDAIASASANGHQQSLAAFASFISTKLDEEAPKQFSTLARVQNSISKALGGVISAVKHLFVGGAAVGGAATAAPQPVAAITHFFAGHAPVSTKVDEAKTNVDSFIRLQKQKL